MATAAGLITACRPDEAYQGSDLASSIDGQAKPCGYDGRVAALEATPSPPSMAHRRNLALARRRGRRVVA